MPPPLMSMLLVSKNLQSIDLIRQFGANATKLGNIVAGGFDQFLFGNALFL